MSNINADANNGMLTKIWGRFSWPTIHCITFGYMVTFDSKNPDHVKRKEGVKNTLLNLADCWPCVYCRDSYAEFISDPKSPAYISDEIFSSRDSLTRWGFRLHQRVNLKLGVDYGLSYEDIIPIYESFRAKCVEKDKGCTMPIDLKAKSYLMANIRHAPVISKEFAKEFCKYAKIRGIEDYDNILNHYNSIISHDRVYRDSQCVNIIDYMRKSSINCTETSGKYEGLPTKYELILLSMRCSNISSHEHKNLIQKLKDKNLS